MFLRGEHIEEDIELRAYSEVFPDLIDLPEHIQIENGSCSRSWLVQPSEDRECCCLSSSVVTQKGEDLVLVHGEGEIIDCYLSIIVNLLEASYFHSVPCSLKLSHIGRDSFEILVMAIDLTVFFVLEKSFSVAVCVDVG